MKIASLLILIMIVGCGPSDQPEKMRITGFNGNALIYEDLKGQTYERNPDGHYFKAGKIIDEKGE